MALRQAANSNQENVNSRINVKGALIQPAKTIQSRSALGEVGNKLPTVNNYGALKKVGTTRSQIATFKKIEVATDVTKKENAKQTTTKASNESLKSKKIDVQKPSSGNLTSFSTKQIPILDPDEATKNEPQMVTEYIEDIFAHLRDLEDRYVIRPNFLKNHETTPRMRSVLVNWLAEVALNFKVYLETYHLCVSIVDRYLQDNPTVGRSSLQLIGTGAMYVACKYEEMYIPDLSDFVYICDDTFSSRQILLTELEIIKKLDFSFGRPLSLHFLRRYNKVAQAKPEQHTLGKYILELVLLEYELCHVKPSIQAAAACCLSLGILNDIMDLTKVWTPTMVHYTTYKFSDFRHVMIDIAHMLVKAETSKYQIIRSKYASSKYGKISLDKRLSSGLLVRKLTSMLTSSKK